MDDEAVPQTKEYYERHVDHEETTNNEESSEEDKDSHGRVERNDGLRHYDDKPRRKPAYQKEYFEYILI